MFKFTTLYVGDKYLKNLVSHVDIAKMTLHHNFCSCKNLYIHEYILKTQRNLNRLAII